MSDNEFLAEQLDDEEMISSVRMTYTLYYRALGWVLEEEHIWLVTAYIRSQIR